MALVPVDASPSEVARAGGFSVTRRGYSPRQVHEHLRQLDARILLLEADRNAVLEQRAELNRQLDRERAENQRLRARLNSLAAPPSSSQGLSERLRLIFELAQREAAEVREQARLEARSLASRGQIELLRNEKQRNRLDQEQQRLAAERTRVHEVAEQTRMRAERAEADAAARARLLVADAGREALRIRAVAQEESTAEAQARRVAVDAVVRDELAAGRAEVEVLLAKARTQAASTTTSARRVASVLTSASEELHHEADRTLAQARVQAQQLVGQGRAEAERVLTEAHARAERTTDRADRAAAETAGTRDAMHNQLRELRRLLDQGVGQLQPPQIDPALIPPQREPEPVEVVGQLREQSAPS